MGDTYQRLISPGNARRPGGIRTKALAFVALLAALLILPPLVSAELPPLVIQTVHFEVPGHDLIPDVAAFRASCDVIASGEPISLRDNETVRTAVEVAPSACSMILILFGVDVGIPTITTTPIGRSSFYIPGLTTLSLGIVDVSLDLQTSMNSSSMVPNPDAATLQESEIQWGTWGAHRLVIQGAHSFGSNVTSDLETGFTYSLALGITIWVAGIEFYHTNLTDFGHYGGDHSLTTSLVADLLPHPLSLGPARSITYAGASLNWTGTVDPDVGHLELWLADGSTNVSYRIEDPHATALNVDLRATTTYTAWIAAVDGSGQETVSRGISFRTLAVPPPTSSPPPTYTESQANLVVVGTFLFIALLAGAVAYGFGRVRGRT